jgi:excisionase family DNA binding protein
MNEILAPAFLKKAEVARMLRVSERTVEIWVRNGFIPAFRLGRTIRFDRDAILEHLRQQQLAAN